MATDAFRGVPLSTLCPKFLHANSTSHTWPFSAIAELIDNAYDPDVSAKQFWIDKTMVKGELCLTFMDNGNGLDHKTMHKMLSFGYSDKVAVNGKEPIGIYGNGFKSGSMRLGKDAIVFSKSKSTSCVGMLSQTYLEKIGAQQIIVPIVCFENTKSNNFRVSDDDKASLMDILRYSPFKSNEELLAEISAISSSFSLKKTGTRIIIWNLRGTTSGKPEFDFQKDRYDIQIPSDVYEGMNNSSPYPDRSTAYIPESVFSLRAYCSILYLKPRMQVIIRGQKVKSQLIAKSLAHIRKDHYKPIFLNKRIPIIFGYNTKSKDQYGIMMYHKNRLIKAYERVGCQLRANNKGVGVIGVIECNFLDPTHNKQSFNETDKYRKTMINLGTKLEEYWNEIRFRTKKDNPNSTVPVEDTMKRPDQNWAQCDECLQWRKLPDGIDCSKLPEKWFCRMNPDPQFRSCKVEEEPEDSDDDQPSYCKTYKLQEREDRRKQEMLEEQRRLATLQKQEEIVKKQHEQVTRQLRQMPPSISRPPGLPIITSVCSLSQGVKRIQPCSSQITPKRLKVNGFHEGTLFPGNGNVTPVLPHSSNDDNVRNEADDDIVILETGSTPKPQKPAADCRKVKKEEENTEKPVGVPPASFPRNAAAPLHHSSTTTQTDVHVIKREAVTLPQRNVAAASNGTATNSGENRGVPNGDAGGGGESLPNGNLGPVSAHDSGTHITTNRVSIISEAQKQKDQIRELVQQRDALKEQVKELQSQLQETQNRLEESLQVNVKKESSHQACQTVESTEKDYKSLFDSAKQKINDLIKDKVTSSPAVETEAEPGPSHDKEKELNEICSPVGHLVKELEERNKEKNELRLQLDRINEEKANLAAAQRDELRLNSLQIKSEEPGRSADSDEFTRLLELRQNVGRLLITHVPALDLSQVNFECNVIDEILEQVVSSMDS